jgi:glycosyltransferase involved in cell wall biosynthesis
MHIMAEPLGVSIIVVNYNNEPFLAAAIDSALGQIHTLCEVIVVDDCSTDNSRAVIARYGDRVRSVLREQNGGQVVAQDNAWPLARYPILIFLDSDDLLLPDAAATFAAIWTPATVKAQAPLATIDKAGRQLGHVAPKYPPNLDTATIRAELLRTGGSPNSANSGNAYSRSLLARIRADGGFDLEDPREFYMDALLECNAPFYGEVVTLYEPLSCYRIHGSNAYAINSIENAGFASKYRREERKIDYMARRCQHWGIPFDPVAARKASVQRQECRLFAAKLAEQPVNELIPITLYGAIKAYISTPMPFAYRIIRIMWLVSVATAPRGLASRLLELRFVPGQRPAWLDRLLIAARKLGATRRSPQHPTPAAPPHPAPNP